MSAFLKNSAIAFRLAFFQRIAGDCISIAWWQVAAFAVASLLIPVVYDIASIGAIGQVQWYAIPSAMVHLPFVLFAAIAAAYALGKGEKTPLLLQAFLMITAAIDAVIYAASLAADVMHAQSWLQLFTDEYYFLPAFWLAAACARAAVGVLAFSFERTVLAYSACVIFLALPLSELYPERSLWQEVRNYGELAADVGHAKLNEDVLYRQPKILERELAALRPGRRGVIDVYFIGVGGYAAQDVFMKEVDAVSRLFRERFGSEGKTVRLVNNLKSVTDSPLASVTSLRASLQRVSELMDKDEDVLFLFLTSHASKTHRFSLEFSGLKFHELDPAKLRALLDEAGIKNRVVVISACYSGGFIDALKSENTLVISAAAADKNSFGCSDAAEWTYFGRAYFDEALRKTYSFVEAFELARPVIAERERKEGYTPSEPQMALGQGIKPKLLSLERQLAGR